MGTKNLSRKLVALWIFLGCFLFIILRLHFTALEESRNYYDWDRNAHIAINNNTLLFLSIIQAQNEQRNYLLTNSSEILQSYYHTKARAFAQLKALREASAVNISRRLSVDTLNTLFNERFYHLDKGISLSVQNRQEQVAELISSNAGSNLMQALNRQISSLNSYEEQLLAQRSESIERNTNLSFMTLIIGLASVFLFVTVQWTSIRIKTRKRIVEHKRIIHDREVRYKELTENMPGLFYSYDYSLSYFQWNKACEKFTGLKKEKVIGKKLGEIFNELHEEKLNSVYPEVLQTRKPRKLLIDFTHQGQHYVHDLTIFPTAFGISVLRMDITEQKESEEKLLYTEGLLSEAQQLAKVGNWNFDVLRNEFFWSEGIRETFGVDHDFKPSFDALLSMIHPEDKDRVVKRIMESGKTGEYAEDEYRIIRTDGQVRVLKALTRFTFDDLGRALRIFGISQDITELKRAQREILEMLENLQKRNKDLKQFAYFLSHNLRAPIAKILGITALLESTEGLQPNPMLTKYIADEAAHLDEIVKDVNHIISLDNPDQDTKEYVPFEEELTLIKEVLSTGIEESGALISADFSEVPGVYTVKSYLYSILYNLISNSIKYRSADRKLQIEITTALTPGYHCLTVSDNGSGIDLEKHKDKIFGFYKRFHGKEIEGKGMGLYLIKTQVEALGGQVEMESEPDMGTTVKVYFPVGDN
jgi:PAS domain S-box-containing protein